MAPPRKHNIKVKTKSPRIISRSLIGKRVRNLDCRPKPLMWWLPDELLVDVLARVASSSVTDLFNARLSCRCFLRSSEEDYVFENIAIDKVFWSRSVRAIEFLNRCISVGNPEALFRQGAIEYLGLKRVELGLDYLRRGAEKKDAKSIYLYGMILLSVGGESTQHGLKILNSMKLKNWSSIRECRAKVKDVLRMMWDAKNPVPKRDITCLCNKTRCWRVEYYDEKQRTCVDCRWLGHDLCSRHNTSFWSVEDGEVNQETCDDCRWFVELSRFYEIVSHD